MSEIAGQLSNHAMTKIAREQKPLMDSTPYRGGITADRVILSQQSRSDTHSGAIEAAQAIGKVSRLHLLQNGRAKKRLK
jgi:hypothetical protein